MVLHDTGALSAETLVAAREIDAEFSWRELLRRKIRHVRVAGAEIHARSNASSQLSLANLIGPTTAQAQPRPPFWIGALEVDGRVKCEPIAGVAASGCDWPLTIHMTMSGDQTDPARKFRAMLGDLKPESAFVLTVENLEAPGAGKPIRLGKLGVRNANFSVEAGALRTIVPSLPLAISGKIGLRIPKLVTAGTLYPAESGRNRRISGLLDFEGVQLRLPGKSAPIFSVEDLSGGGARFNTALPMDASSRVHSFQLTGRGLSAAVDAATLRGYFAKLPADVDGLFTATLDVFHIVGSVEADRSGVPHLATYVKLNDLAVQSPGGGKHAMGLELLDLSGTLDAPIGPNPLAGLAVHDGLTRCTALSIRENRVNNLDVAWQLDGPKLALGRFSAEVFDGTLTGAPAFDLATHQMANGDFQIKSIDVHKALANVSPEHLDAVGKATGAAHLALSAKGELSGVVDLSFDGPGTLRVGQIDEVKQMLVGNFGLDLANLAMHDLEHYPFRQGALHL
ncbi:MAG TPA: hypothetical protein VEU51_15495, partial [Candidatus Acidoferrales bacterium]|nr:hypothetical protein [Candidatus Acidoferrales bacterium]